MYLDENLLVCYLAVPTSISNLDRYLDDAKDINETKFNAPPTGTLAIATEFVTPSAATSVSLFYKDDMGSNYLILCLHQ